MSAHHSHQTTVVMRVAASLDTATICRRVRVPAFVDDVLRNPAGVNSRRTLSCLLERNVHCVDEVGGDEVTRRILHDRRTVASTDIVLVSEVAINANLNVATSARMSVLHLHRTKCHALSESTTCEIAEATRASLGKLPVRRHATAELNAELARNAHPRCSRCPAVAIAIVVVDIRIAMRAFLLATGTFARALIYDRRGRLRRDRPRMCCREPWCIVTVGRGERGRAGERIAIGVGTRWLGCELTARRLNAAFDRVLNLGEQHIEHLAA